MASGGARARSGPAPDPNALTRDKVRKSALNGEWVKLPASGRKGRTPPWPLDREKAPTKAEVKELEARAADLENELAAEAASAELARIEKVQRIQKREGVLWARLWRKPQAIVWDLFGQHDEVAIYVRTLVDSEQIGARPNVRTLLRQQQEALGLSLPGLARNRWVIVDDEAAAAQPAPAPQAASTPARPSARDRFNVLPGGQPG